MPHLGTPAHPAIELAQFAHLYFLFESEAKPSRAVWFSTRDMIFFVAQVVAMTMKILPNLPAHFVPCEWTKDRQGDFQMFLLPSALALSQKAWLVLWRAVPIRADAFAIHVAAVTGQLPSLELWPSSP